MTLLCAALVLAFLVPGTQAQLGLITEVLPLCDSVEAEAAAVVAQDYLNAQHTHGYKYALNRVEDIKIQTKPDGGQIYLLEVELLQTHCHVLDPTPLANCTVRPKTLTAVEADCDVALTNVSGVLSVIAFKCKSEESTEDICLGCPTLLPLNDTAGLDMVSASLATFNNKTGSLFALMELGRMTSQIVSGGPTYSAEYVIVETNCTDVDSDNCQPLALAQRGFCLAKGLSSAHTVDCSLFPTLLTPVVTNATNATVPVAPPVVYVHTGNLPANHGLRHHKLTSLHDPSASGLLSAESAESAEVVPVVVVPGGPLVPDISATIAAPSDQDVPIVGASVAGSLVPEEPVVVSDDTEESGATIVKREAPTLDVAPAAASPDILLAPPLLLVPRCPGKIRYFD